MKNTFFINFLDSRHFQLSIHAVFDEESDVQVKHSEIQQPEANNQEKQMFEQIVRDPLIFYVFIEFYFSALWFLEVVSVFLVVVLMVLVVVCLIVAKVMAKPLLRLLKRKPPLGPLQAPPELTWGLGSPESAGKTIIIAPRFLPFSGLPVVGFGPKSAEMNPSALPDLPIHTRTVDFEQKM